ncbi:carbohydrate esterase family 1 protein [Zasmidium cellare ATCC 36951]|uniref:feruloyl esterase n=1 Tax=Zasmidium cellare ATCC 36951 TaxID=1080233 RepID=A0A6A6D6H9_ZASCE|nr:carbohydrate esterase family 1 protein [Zasmidium cellare ATCC 36951]KAF2173769.1 carbohydrate esterase family 1 protein [Zasmidium cellare ATCC 36951]
MPSPTLLSLLALLSTAQAFTPSPGCSKALPQGTTLGSTGSSNSITITSSGRSRTFLLHIPTNYNTTARGLILSYHGRGKTAASQEQLSSFSDPYFNPDLLAVYPQGVGNQWQGDPEATTDDVQFALDMIDYLTPRYCVDTDAIYATGKSNGEGFSANILACNATATDRIAAFASASGAYCQCNASKIPIPCAPSRPIPLLEIHGTSDTTIPYDGGARRGECLPSIPHFLQNWASVDNFSSTANVTTQLYGGKVQKYDFGGKVDFLTQWRVEGLGHSWPSTGANGDSSKGTYFNGTEFMMEFFGRYSLK